MVSQCYHKLKLANVNRLKMAQQISEELYLYKLVNYGRPKLIRVRGDSVTFVGTGAVDSVDILKQRVDWDRVRTIKTRDEVRVAIEVLEADARPIENLSNKRPIDQFALAEFHAEISFLKKLL